jgi:23S rRNA (adenine2030-N6)-methyltransferase
MNYRHAFHAGNFADVVKHLALVSILIHLKKKPAPFAVFDTHAGRGLYDLSSDAAKRSGEADWGIERVRELTDGPALLQSYLTLIREFGANAYPGSPLIAAKMLRDEDRLVAIEKHPDEARALAHALKRFKRARTEEADGYARLPALLPPPERRGLILIDPPYEAPDEFARAAQSVADAVRRFATGIVLIWFPIKSAAAANAFCGEVLQSGARKMLRVDIEAGAEGARMAAAGLLAINPPFGFEPEMREALAAIGPYLGRSGASRSHISWLAGSE